MREFNKEINHWKKQHKKDYWFKKCSSCKYFQQCSSGCYPQGAWERKIKPHSEACRKWEDKRK